MPDVSISPEWYATLLCANLRPCAVDHHGAVIRAVLVRPELLSRRKRHTGVGAVEHAREVRLRGGVHEFLLGGLLHETVGLLQGVDGAVDGHGVAISMAEAKVGSP